jgi:hypothetical protein
VIVQAEWIARFTRQFDQGWDVLREQIYARQKPVASEAAMSDKEIISALQLAYRRGHPLLAKVTNNADI